eukprot:2196990-Rhodomonas_salina.2
MPIEEYCVTATSSPLHPSPPSVSDPAQSGGGGEEGGEEGARATSPLQRRDEEGGGSEPRAVGPGGVDRGVQRRGNGVHGFRPRRGRGVPLSHLRAQRHRGGGVWRGNGVQLRCCGP